MQAFNVTVSDLEYAAQKVGLAAVVGAVTSRSVRFTLERTGRKYQRLGFHRNKDGNRRKLGSYVVCWHGHRDFMLALFDAKPDARLKSAMADYRGRADFLASYGNTEHRQVGSMMDPACYGDLCECED